MTIIHPLQLGEELTYEKANTGRSIVWVEYEFNVGSIVFVNNWLARKLPGVVLSDKSSVIE